MESQKLQNQFLLTVHVIVSSNAHTSCLESIRQYHHHLVINLRQPHTIPPPTTMQSPTKSSIAASYQGPAMFHSAMARFKRMRPARGPVAAPKTSFAETADETSSEGSVSEIVVEDIGAATRLYVSRNDITAMERRHDSLLIATTEQAANNSKIHTLTPRLQRKDLRRSLVASGYFKQQPDAPCTTADAITLEDEGNGESITTMQKRTHERVALLDDRQRELAQIVANINAQEVAAAQERAWEVQIRAARERRMAAAERLAQRVVAEVVPMSASGRAYGDVKEIRRCAAAKVEGQMVPDGSYPRFRPSS
jgi:hypothetical protein